MKLQNNNKGFTLIELLVVITIIGILATGATATYITQIQKARDTTRISDIKVLQSAAEQVYQDRSEYPPSGSYFLKDGGADKGVAISTYVQKIPKDPKNGQTCNNGGSGDVPTCVYLYKVNVDDNGINKGAFVFATAFEAAGKVTTDAKKDGGKQDVRWEVGNGLNLSGAIDIGLVKFVDIEAAKMKAGSGILSVSGASLIDNDWKTQGTTITINGN